MKNQYYLDCIDKAITLYWRTLARARGMKLYNEDFEYVLSDNREGPERIFNINIPIENIGTRLGEIVEKIEEGLLPDSFLLTHNTRPENLSELLKEIGFELDYSGLCMVMDLKDLKYTIGKSETGSVHEVNNIESLRHWVHIINTALFGFEIMSLEQFYDIFSLKNTRFYLCCYDNVPASACFTIRDGEVGDLDMVATLSNYRKKGLASQIVKRALHDLSISDVKTVSLRAEVDGISLYNRIGFKEYCKRITATYNRKQ